MNCPVDPGSLPVLHLDAEVSEDELQATAAAYAAAQPLRTFDEQLPFRDSDFAHSEHPEHGGATIAGHDVDPSLDSLDLDLDLGFGVKAAGEAGEPHMTHSGDPAFDSAPTHRPLFRDPPADPVENFDDWREALPLAHDTTDPGLHSAPGRLPAWAHNIGDAGDLEIPAPYRSARPEPLRPRVSNRKKLIVAGVAASALAVGGLGATFIIVVSGKPLDETEAQLKQINAGKAFMGCANAQGVIEKMDPPKTVLELKQLQSFGCQAYVVK